MANSERVGRALVLLRDGLGPACEAAWRRFYGDGWLQSVNSKLHGPERDPSAGDVAFLCNGMKATWDEVFGRELSPGVRNWVFEVANIRNRWAHQDEELGLSSDDVLRGLDSMERLLEVFGNTDQRAEIHKLRHGLMRQVFEEASRGERRRAAAQATEGTPQPTLTPWRDIITPHQDVASGNFVQAEYAADLWQVANGGAEAEYQDPREFFARTYITQGLRDLLTGAARRLAGEGGDADDQARARIAAQRDRGSFAAVQVFAAGSGDVPDNDDGVRLVILEPDATHSPNDTNSPAVALAERILAQRHGGQRLNRNLVLFAAAANRLPELRGAARLYLAWKSIVADDSLDLTTHQKRQAQTKLAETSQQVDSLIAETFILVLVPSQEPGTADVVWQTIRVNSAGDIAARISSKLGSEEQLIDAYHRSRVRMDIDRLKLWSERGDVAVHRLWETYARFLHMPRLAGRDVLYDAIAGGDTTLTWLQDSFAYADGHDGNQWTDLRTDTAVVPAPTGLLIHPERLPEPDDPPDPPPGKPSGGTGDPPPDPPSGDPEPAPDPVLPTEFYAQFQLDFVRCIKQLDSIIENVGKKLGDSDIELVLEVRAKNQQGFNEAMRRTVSENSRNLEAQSSEFE